MSPREDRGLSLHKMITLFTKAFAGNGGYLTFIGMVFTTVFPFRYTFRLLIAFAKKRMFKAVIQFPKEVLLYSRSNSHKHTNAVAYL